MERILILGAAGFIGQHLARRLKDDGREVIGYDRFEGNGVCQMICGNFSTEDQFEVLLRENRIDTVYHMISTTVPQEATDAIPLEIGENIIPTVRLLEGMKNAGTKRLIFSSSGGTIYGESDGTPHKPDEGVHPLCGYGVHKAVIELYLQFYADYYGLDCRIARISNPYGIPPQKKRVQGIIPIFMKYLLEHKPIVLFGDTVRDYIHIDDVVEALVRFGMYEGPGRILNIGTGCPVQLSEIVREIEAVAGEKFVEVEKRQRRSCDVEQNVLDISATEDALHWRPEISLQAGIARTWKELTGVQ